MHIWLSSFKPSFEYWGAFNENCHEIKKLAREIFQIVETIFIELFIKACETNLIYSSNKAF